MVADRELSIGQMAERTGPSVHTLRFYEAADVDWLGICTRLRTSGMPLVKIKRFAELVRQGPGNEQERLELLLEHKQRVTAQVAELNECLAPIPWKAGIYEQRLTEGTAGHLWTAGT